MTIYLDSSAIVKLIVAEDESEALTSFLENQSRTPGGGALVSGDISRTEVLAAVHRAGYAPARAYAVLETLVLHRLTPAMCESAGRIAGEQEVRSLDALHLAVAVSMRDALSAFVTYDNRLTTAANRLGLTTLAPR